MKQFIVVVMFLAVIFLVGVSLTACSIAGQGASAPDTTAIRTPKPTFTPTPVEPIPAPPTTGEQAATPADDQVAAPVADGDNTPRAIINTPLVNMRLGPDTSYDIVSTVERGEEFDILGRNPQGDWWFVCCSDDEYVWVFAELVDTNGAVDGVPITGGATDSAPAAVTPQPVTPTPAPAPVAQFDLIRQEQFAETGLVRVYLYATDEAQGLAGYTARITKDGQQLPVAVESFGGQPAFTWPFQDARQRHQNFKIEYPDINAAGTWEIQLLNADGMVVGPTARFELTADDPQKELYVRYERQ